MSVGIDLPGPFMRRLVLHHLYQMSRYRRLVAAAGVLAILFVAASVEPPSAAASSPRSFNVALVPDAGGSSSAGTMPTSGTVKGESFDSFDAFNFANLPSSQVTPAQLARFDTVVLTQVQTSVLSVQAKSALATFVTNGGKLIIHDSDSTVANDYSWLPVPAQTGQSCPNCGNTTGTSKVIENNTLVSAFVFDASYVNVDELPGATDAVGDANVMTTQDPRWFVDVRATNSVGQTGAVHTYASNRGLIVYNGYDTDAVGRAEASGVDWLAKMWYRELLQPWNPDGLPHGTPIAPRPVAPGGGNANGTAKPPNISKNLLSYAGKAVQVGFGVLQTVAATAACAGTTPLFEVGVPEVLCGLDAEVIVGTGTAAKDPPDPGYNQVFRYQRFAIPRGSARCKHLSRRACRTFEQAVRSYLTATSAAASWSEAVAVTANRFGGAVATGNAEAADLQRAAEGSYLPQQAAAFVRLHKAAGVLARFLGSHKRDRRFSAKQMARARHGLLSLRGIPASYIKRMERTGLIRSRNDLKKMLRYFFQQAGPPRGTKLSSLLGR